MLVRYFRRPSRIEQLRSSTGGHLLEGFAKELSQGRYQWVAARKHIRAAEHFLHWIAHRNLSITSVEERYAQQFFDHLKRCRCRGHHPPLKPHRQKYSVDLWFDYLRRVGIVPTPTFVEPAVEAPMLTAFCDWMRRQRGVSDATLSIYSFELGAFIKELGEDPRMYDALNLRQFVLDKSQHSGWASARKCICAIRMLLRFSDLAGKVPRVSLCVNPYFRPLAALCFAILFTSRSGRTGHRVPRSRDFARKAKPSDSSLARTPGASGERHCSTSARRPRLEGRDDPGFRKGTPPNLVATDPRGWRCAGGLHQRPSPPS